MSVGSLGLLTPSTVLKSDISLISHPDTSNSTVDSLECSVDSLTFEDAKSTADKMNDNIEEINDLSVVKDKLDLEIESSNRNTSDSKGAQELEKQKSDENGNEHTYNDVTKRTDEMFSPKEQGSSPKKSRIPKSKTFDNTASVYRNGNTVRQYGHRNCIDTGSRNHVFMTSQECMVVPGSSKLPRETIASRLRYEKQVTPHGSMTILDGDGNQKDGYQTPSQRKDILLRDMRRQVREAKTVCEDKDRDIAMYKQHIDEETSRLVQSKDEEIAKLREELRKLKQSYDDISSFCEESISTASSLEQKAQHLRLAMDDREKEHQRIYLEMYKKGQHSARFEREEELDVISEANVQELERLASAGGCTVTISELVKKLAWTELELAKWQTIRREESYQEALQPGTESYTTLRFLKDAFFHYITDERDSDHHLRAMIKIFKYTEPQMVKIKESRLIEAYERRNRTRTKKSSRNKEHHQ